MQKRGSLSGGRKLREIRDRKGWSQLDMEMQAGVIAQPNYSLIERGVSMPKRATLDVILNALEATFTERQTVLKYFGYLPGYPLPTEEEIERIRIRCQPLLDAVSMPAYVIDFVTRLISWNEYFPKLLGDDECVLEAIRNMPLFKAQFDTRVRLGDHIENLDFYLLEDAKMIRKRLIPYQGEDWYNGFIEKLCADSSFRTYWNVANSAAHREVTPFATRLLEPVRFNVPTIDKNTPLHFYANLDPLDDDERFQIIYLIPANIPTMQQIARWGEAIGG